MSLNRSNVRYVLPQFNAGVSPHKILCGLQYRTYLPGINFVTIERCLRKNGHLQDNNQTGHAALSSQSREVGRRDLDSVRNREYNIAREEVVINLVRQGVQVATADHVDFGPFRRWDVQADSFALSAYRSGQSWDEICLTLRNRGYDITRADVVINLIRQGGKVARQKKNPSWELREPKSYSALLAYAPNNWYYIKFTMRGHTSVPNGGSRPQSGNRARNQSMDNKTLDGVLLVCKVRYRSRQLGRGRFYQGLFCPSNKLFFDRWLGCLQGVKKQWSWGCS